MKRRLIRLMPLVLLALSGCAGSALDVQPLYSAGATDATRSADDWLAEGRKAYAEDRCGLGIRYFRNALNAAPNSIAAMNGLAACYDRLKRFELAERFYRAALVQDPHSAETLNNVGFSYYLQDKPDLALSYLREAALRRADNARINSNIRLAEAALDEPEPKTRTQRSAAKGHPLIAPRTPSEPPAQDQLTMVRVDKATHLILTKPSRLAWQAAVLEPPVRGDGAAAPKPAAAAAEPERIPARQDFRAAAPEINRQVTGPIPAPPLAVPISFDAAPSDDEQTARHRPDPALRGRLTVEVVNGAGRRRMAARMRQYLTLQGYDVGWLSNADDFRHNRSTIFYKPGLKDAAWALAESLPILPMLIPREDQRASLELELGGDLLDFDRGLIARFGQRT